MSEATESTSTEIIEAGEVRIRRALLSVSDKRGLVDFARGLKELGVEILSTGGTARELGEAGSETRSAEDELGVQTVSPGGAARERGEAGIDTRSVDAYPGFPEILDGRVKTINPRMYAG